MRAKDVAVYDVLASESVTMPSLGGDGVVTVRGIGFGQKIQLSVAAPEMRAPLLLQYAVRDETGAQLMTAEQWDLFGLHHEDDFLELTSIARRVSAFDAEQAKKN